MQDEYMLLRLVHTLGSGPQHFTIDIVSDAKLLWIEALGNKVEELSLNNVDGYFSLAHVLRSLPRVAC